MRCLTLGIICLLILTACFSPWKGGDEGTFTIIIGSPDNSRKALPWDESLDIEDLTHTIEISDDQGNEQSVTVKGSQSVHFTVEPGLWKIFIQAYILADGEKIIKAESDRKSVNIRPGKNGAITITMNMPGNYWQNDSVPVTGVTLDSTDIELKVGGHNGTLIATVEPDNATNKNVTWKSSNTGVVTVTAGENGRGTVALVSEGEAVITVTTQNGNKTATCNVTVFPADSNRLTGKVTITGTPEVGEMLTVDTSALDVQGDFTYQWKRGDTLENAEDIGRNSRTYTTVSADGGNYIWVVVTLAEYEGKPSAKIGPIIIPVTLESVKANGSPTETTTTLTLTFDKVIPGLTADDITLVGVDGIIKGSLTHNGNGAFYDLKISGFTSGGNLSVSVLKTGYNISGSPQTVKIYAVFTVTFNTNGGSFVNSQIVTGGGNVTKPIVPTNDGHIFDGWYNESFSTKYNFNTPVTANITLYAKWLEPFTTIEALNTWLSVQDNNAAATAYYVKLDVSGLNGTNLATVLKDNNNKTKYVNLDLSGSTFPSNNIAQQAFYQCTSLTGVTIPNTVISIGQQAFSGCTYLTSITVPNNVTSIGQSAFQGCTRLSSVTLPTNPNFKIIDGYAFQGCTVLNNIIIPNSVTTINQQAFANCDNLTSVTIPSSVTSIGEIAFGGCARLIEINVEGANNSYMSDDGILYNKNKTTLVRYPAGKLDNSFIIPSSVTSIANGAFGACSLANVTIPESVTSIGQSAFNSCKNLVNVNIPSKVTSIGSSTFQNCPSLANITIPATVTSIGSWAFNFCTSLASVTFEGTISSTGFSNSDAFLGDLREKYLDATTGGIGTYTTNKPVSSSSNWTKTP